MPDINYYPRKIGKTSRLVSFALRRLHKFGEITVLTGAGVQYMIRYHYRTSANLSYELGISIDQMHTFIDVDSDIGNKFQDYFVQRLIDSSLGVFSNSLKITRQKYIVKLSI